jgi:hypothetical protein
MSRPRIYPTEEALAADIAAVLARAGRPMKIMEIVRALSSGRCVPSGPGLHEVVASALRSFPDRFEPSRVMGNVLLYRLRPSDSAPRSEPLPEAADYLTHSSVSSNPHGPLPAGHWVGLWELT